MCVAICAQSSAWRGVLHAASVLPVLAALLARAAEAAAAVEAEAAEAGAAAPTKGGGKGGDEPAGGDDAASGLLPLLTNVCLAANHCTIDVPPALSPQLPPFVRLLLPLLPPPPPPVAAATDAAADASDAEKATSPDPNP